MNVTQQTRNLPTNACPTDFTFLYALIDELKHIPAKSKVFFPTANRGQAPAAIDCHLGYNKEGKANGEFRFSMPTLNMEMAHTAVVTYTSQDGVLMYHLEIRPNKRLRSNKHKSRNSVHPDARTVALAIVANYMPGSVGRKIVPTREEALAA